MNKIIPILYLLLVLVSASMAAYSSFDFDGVAGSYASVASTPVTAEPATMAGWIKADDADTAYNAFFIGDVSESADYLSCQPRGDVTGDPIRAQARDGGTENADTTTGFSAGTWHHIACVFASDTSRTAYIDGGDSATNTTSIASSAYDGMALGRLDDVSPGLEFAGKLVYWAVWDTNLSSAEIARLAGGECPLTVHSSNLVAYYPGADDRGGGEIADEDTGTYDLTIAGTVAFHATDNPPVSCKARSMRRNSGND